METVEKERSLRWKRLDNAALIFPAALRRHWSNAYRIAFTFRDPVDPGLLQMALDHTAPRFPLVCARLRRSFFWYYLEEVARPPAVREDSWQPLVRMSRADVRKCAIRVLYYRDRMAVEFFHAVTDGTGAMVFAKTLAAEYARLRYEVQIPPDCGIKDLSEAPRESELVDSFQENAGPVAAPRDDGNVYHLSGALEPDRFLHDTLGILESERLLAEARKRGVTVTAYLTALLLQAILEIQAEEVPRRRRRKPVKVQIPVNLRRLFGGETLRNFVAVANIGVDARLGDYSFEELVHIAHHQMQLEITPKRMQAIFTPNVKDEQNPVMKAVPLFLKNPIMRMVFDTVGERVSCLSLSNLGDVKLPEEMAPFVRRVEFILGPQASAPYNCGVCSWNGETYIHITRNSVEPKLEQRFFTALVRMGYHVRIEANSK